MISRELVLCLGTISVVASLLFLYTKNRVLGLEHKVNMLFKLIESHHVENQQKKKTEENLINVSDDESDTDDESETSYESESDFNGKTKKIEILEQSITDNTAAYSNLIEKISPPEKKTNDISELTVKELKKLCGDKGLNKYSGLNKDGLIELLNNNNNNS
tara:strand:+ start:300 stop:782 length:483 start_codon:yes stop_codon:yes gene_type:complete